MSAELSSPRLHLIALSATQLESCLNNLAALEAQLGFPISRELVDANATHAINMKLAKMATVDTRFHHWLTYWLIVIKDVSFGAGLIGFKGYPNDRGETEIGYGIDVRYRNQGYMTEALKTLCQWAFEHPKCQAITATSVSKPASDMVLEKLKWHKIRQNNGCTDWEIRKELIPTIDSTGFRNC